MNRGAPLPAEAPIREGQVLTGSLFSKPMQVETVRNNGRGVWVAGLVGQRSERFRRVTLTLDDISNLTIADPTLSYQGDGRLLRIALQAYSLGIAYEFDPYFGLSISRVDPLPHQLEAVYEHLLKLPSVRFLLADDAGAGKTIMAGLLVRELKLRGLVERVLVVCPANLSFQWQRELKEKFDEKFLVLKGSDIRDQFGVNQFVATNTIEGRVLQRLLDKLQEIRDALDDDAVFNVVGEVLPSTHVERVLRDYYAGKLGDVDLEERLLKDVDEGHFRAICQTALEGLAAKKLNLDMLIERRARAQERRVVPETIARFIRECAEDAGFSLKPVNHLKHAFQPGRTPSRLKRYERENDWKLAELATRYPRLSTDRETAEKHNLEWVTPGHALFEALRRHGIDGGQDAFAKGACFHSLAHETPVRLDFYRARIVDGLGKTIHERLFTVELDNDDVPRRREPDALGNLSPAPVPDVLPAVAALPEETSWLNENVLTPFLDDVRSERLAEVERIGQHVELSLTEVLQRIDEDLGRAADEVTSGDTGAEGRLAQAESRHAEVLARRERRREELQRQRAVTLQGVERLASVLILPHPDRGDLDVRRLRPHPETEMTAMRAVMEYEQAQGRQVYDVHEKNLGYDVTSLDLRSGELRLIEVKGLAAATGSILLTPNERRVAEDRRDCYWLYVVTNCASTPELQEPVRDPARFPWHEVTKVQHYWLQVDAVAKPMQVRECPPPYPKGKFE